MPMLKHTREIDLTTQAQRPDHGTRGLQPERASRVRCIAWLGAAALAEEFEE